MSRSRRKYPRFGRNNQWFKRYCNKCVRHADIDSGGAFKKVGDSYDICDYRGVLLTRAEIEDYRRRYGTRALLKGFTK